MKPARFLCTLFCVGSAIAQKLVDFSALEWSVSRPALNINVPGNFPSHVHLDLYAAGVIGDPLVGLNDFNLRWIAWSNWTYGTILPETAAGGSTWLLFQGLDTFTTIGLCNKHVATTNNQFRQYYFDVTNIIKDCKYALELNIEFGSAPNVVDAIAAEPGQQKWPYGVEQTFEFPNRQFMRKQQSDFGWDWGPAFAPAGPWRPGYLIQLDDATIYPRNVLVDIYKRGQRNNLPPDQNQPWVINASIDYLGVLPDTSTISYVLRDSRNGTVHAGSFNEVRHAKTLIQGSTVIPTDSIQLWWPNGLGEQNLYDLVLHVMDGSSQIVATVTRRIGFRTIVLSEEVISDHELDKGIAPGNHWHFEINGKEFFAKGSNFIPPDPFWPRVSEGRIRQLFESVVAGNQNMLRIWSSGAYSPDFLYDIADELGILCWSEFQFGDSLYPINAPFLENVRDEVNYQVRRINHHPSLAFWAGGNELENLELLLVNRSAPDEYEYYKDQYEELFLRTIVPQVFDNTRSISYSPSSTSNGHISLNFTTAPYFHQRYELKEPGSIYGVTDYYNYDSAQAFNISSYPIGRFSNEFGHHSMPSLQTWKQAVSAQHLSFNSSVIVLRNHHYPPGNLSTTNYHNSSLGMGEMTRAAQLWYPVPSKTDPIANFSAWCHTTQIFQADYYRSQIGFYRRASGMPQRQLGALYWQLEDMWQAPTWAGIEYDGRWKVLHYAAKDIFQNVIVAPYFNASTCLLEVYVTSDLWESVEGSVDLGWYTWAGERVDIMGLDENAVTVGPLNTSLVFSANMSSLLADYDPANIVAKMSVAVKGSLPNSNSSRIFSHSNWFHATPLSKAGLVDPGLTLNYDSRTAKFAVKATKGIAAWVWLDYPEGAVVAFDANGFWLARGESMSIGYTVKSDTTNGGWMAGVTVESIWNNTLAS